MFKIPSYLNNCGIYFMQENTTYKILMFFLTIILLVKLHFRLITTEERKCLGVQRVISLLGPFNSNLLLLY